MYRFSQYSLRSALIAVLAVAVIIALVRPRASRLARSIDTEYLTTLCHSNIRASQRSQMKIDAKGDSWYRHMQATVACTAQEAERIATSIEQELCDEAYKHGASLRVKVRGFGTHKGSRFQYNVGKRSGTFDVWLNTDRRIYPNDTRVLDFQLVVSVDERSVSSFGE